MKTAAHARYAYRSSMAMDFERFTLLMEALDPVDTDRARNSYRAAWESGNMPEVHDIERRYRWDVMWTAIRQVEGGWDLIDGLKDDHIDTALRALVPPLYPTTD